jgi:hypothetical protein
MAFTPLTALAAAAAADLLGRPGRIVDLGNQRFRVSAEIVERIVAHKPALGADLRVFMAQRPQSEADTQTGKFYGALGFTSYTAIDVNDQFGSIMMDLNEPLDAAYGYREQFDLVVNNGTGEHVFNQYALFRNMHNLCARDGMMLHIVPFLNYINHGFFNFNPLLYCDLALANGYEVEAIGIGDRDGDVRVLSGKSQSALMHSEQIPLDVLRRSIHGRGDAQPFVKRWRSWLSQQLGRSRMPAWHQIERIVADMLKVSRRRSNLLFPNLMVIALLRRKADDAFVVPFQGKYVTAIDSGSIRSAYKQSAPAQRSPSA